MPAFSVCQLGVGRKKGRRGEEEEEEKEGGDKQRLCPFKRTAAGVVWSGSGLGRGPGCKAVLGSSASLVRPSVF